MHPRPPLQQELFGTPAPRLPVGMRYEEEVLDPDEEAHWLQVVAALPLQEMRYKQYTARRRGASFGGSYDFDANRLDPAEPLPAALQPLRDRVAAWAGLPPERFVHALAAEYRPGTPLGWHRDVPDFEDIVGVSLGAPAVMRFRPWPQCAGLPRQRAEAGGGAALALPAARRVALGLAAQRRAHAGAALLGHLPHRTFRRLNGSPRRAVRSCLSGREPTAVRSRSSACCWAESRHRHPAHRTRSKRGRSAWPCRPASSAARLRSSRG
jgi:alkylated DNA repair dioxygenase AlkB